MQKTIMESQYKLHRKMMEDQYNMQRAMMDKNAFQGPEGEKIYKQMIESQDKMHKQMMESHDKMQEKVMGNMEKMKTMAPAMQSPFTAPTAAK
ncbi:hypothetical protein MAIT1_03444 [Magnetofaba australis IT-1]|uniref:Uncharacterized protein n=1 Tax=Magnetofaba australis IT-1 TaxID=1434232 RepID=A0A1Y2K9C2_9PROT|nr:hypothetical protein MAIT1_03444 [Magnetofaba australis IT-1]